MFKDDRFRHSSVEREAKRLCRSFTGDAATSGCDAIGILREAQRGLEDEDYTAVCRCDGQGVRVRQFAWDLVDVTHLLGFAFYYCGRFSA